MNSVLPEQAAGIPIGREQVARLLDRLAHLEASSCMWDCNQPGLPGVRESRVPAAISVGLRTQRLQSVYSAFVVILPSRKCESFVLLILNNEF